jgi:hypothetical protein
MGTTSYLEARSNSPDSQVLWDDVCWLFRAFAVVLQGFRVWRGIGESMPPNAVNTSLTGFVEVC